MEGHQTEEVDNFTHRGITDKKRRNRMDDKSRITKAMTTFIHLNKIWAAKNIKTRTKLRLFNTTGINCVTP